MKAQSDLNRGGIGNPGSANRRARGVRAMVQSRREEIGLVFFVFLFFYMYRVLQVPVRYPVLENWRLELVLAPVFVLPSILGLLSPRQWRLPSSFWFSVALLLLMMIMVPLSRFPDVSWKAFSERVIQEWIIGLAIASLIDSVRRLRWFMASHLLAFAKMAEESFVGIFTGGLIWENQGTPRLHGATNRYAHPNSLAGTQATTLPFLMKLRGVTKNVWVRRFMLVQMFVAITCIVYTGSRTAYVAVSVWGLLLLRNVKLNAKTIFLGAVLVGIGFQFLPNAYVERFSQIFTQKDKEGGSIEARREITRDAIAIFLEYPLGLGVAAFPEQRRVEFDRLQDTHNLYLEVGTNLGVHGLLLFLAFVYAMFRNLWALEREQKTLQTRVNGSTEAGAVKCFEDLSVLVAVTQALQSFIFIRLGLGIFGHDLYEPYWPFSVGLICALTNLTAQLRVRVSGLPLASAIEVPMIARQSGRRV